MPPSDEVDLLLCTADGTEILLLQCFSCVELNAPAAPGGGPSRARRTCEMRCGILLRLY